MARYALEYNFSGWTLGYIPDVEAEAWLEVREGCLDFLGRRVLWIDLNPPRGSRVDQGSLLEL